MTVHVSTPESVFEEMLGEVSVEELVRWDAVRTARQMSDPRFWERLTIRLREDDD